MNIKKVHSSDIMIPFFSGIGIKIASTSNLLELKLMDPNPLSDLASLLKLFPMSIILNLKLNHIW